jgi:GTP cyclohydrolase III
MIKSSRFFITKFCLCLMLLALGQNSFCQTAWQATSAIERITDTLKRSQCSAVGVGLGKTAEEAQQMADANRDKALRLARRRGRYAFTDKNGSGACNCVKF